MTHALPLQGIVVGVDGSAASAAAVRGRCGRRGPCPQKLERLQHRGDVPPLAVTADIAGQLVIEFQAPLLVV